MSMQLQNITDKDIARSSGSPPTNIQVQAKVVSVHDGDTCDLVFKRNGDFYRFKSRLVGINSPELKTGYTAEKARDFLVWLSLGKSPSSFPSGSPSFTEDEIQSSLDANKELVNAEIQGIDVYDRPLVILQKSSGKSFNQLLMDYGYAAKYQK